MRFDTLHVAITVPIIGVVGLLIFFSMFPTMVGGFNEAYLHAIPACVYNGERFDRVSATVDWRSPIVLSASTDDCTGSGAGTATKFYTPRGTVLQTTDAHISVATGDLTIAGSATEPGRGWSPATGVIEEQGGLNKTLLSVLALGLPVGSMALIIGFGGYFAQRIASPDDGMVGMILSVVGSVISIILLATMMGVFLPSLDSAFQALDSNRYVTFAGGIGSIATLIGNFWGTLMAASVIVVGFQVVRNFSAMKNEAMG